MMNDKTAIKITAIGAIAFLEGIALLKGIDGVILSMVIATISGIAGYSIRDMIGKIKHEEVIR